MNLKDFIRSIPDYPKKGILFRDITTLIKDEKAFTETINQIVEKSKKYKFNKIAAIESRICFCLCSFLYFKKTIYNAKKKINFLLMSIQLILSWSMELLQLRCTKTLLMRMTMF